MLLRRRTRALSCRPCVNAPAVALVGLVTIAGPAGCQKPLFDASVPRTQFELHDRMRNRYKPVTIEDEFGRAQPALRERLGQSANTL